MSNREKILQGFRDRTDIDASVRKALEQLAKIEELADDRQEFDAENLKLPYASADECLSNIWN